ncbi:methyltransferase [Gracilaria domingensis]|nr:methyltransferase [Gracilaria domingensis]
MMRLSEAPDPAPLFALGHYFTASRTFLTAVELGLFNCLSSPKTSVQIQESLELHPNQRTIHDFLDALVALDVITREGDGESAVYGNTASSAAYLCNSSPLYRGGRLLSCSRRNYATWGGLTEVMKNGADKNKLIWNTVWQSDDHARTFLDSMRSMIDAQIQFAERFDFSGVGTMLDVGGGNGQLCCEVAKRQQDVKLVTMDVGSISCFADQYVEQMDMKHRVDVLNGDMWESELPQSDVITMCNVLHCIDAEKKKRLLRKAYSALNEGGRVVSIGWLIDDDRREHVSALLMSLHMAMVTDGGFDYTAREFDGWAAEIGFARTEILPLLAPVHAVIAHK